ncbi:GntG family PLP-dependent aldolase, partial [Roseiflexus sp.]|uniref:GntG family PLP-dependent aldolase n=1 Tax=Roseiflexus sp. TaxID=2562120 RepID=UPI00398AC294
MPSKPIDLRSDTVTLPTPAMRTAMARAEVGDDVYGEDPTVNRLEELAARRAGKAAAMFVSSGTMGNLCALLAHCNRGDEAIVGDCSHIYNYEAGGASVLGGVAFHVVPNQPDGTLALDHLRAAVRWRDDPHCAETRLICLENTHNSCGGVAVSPEYLASVAAFARDHGLLVHLDGARVFNAALALGVDVTELTRHVDSVMFCLSKGLAAPVGSVVCGDEDFIRRARRARKEI